MRLLVFILVVALTALPSQIRADHLTASLLRSVNQLGNANLAITGAILGITTILSMKATESSKFSAVSRLLP